MIVIEVIEALTATKVADFKALVEFRLEGLKEDLQIDLSKTSFIDSAGIATLISLHRKATRQKIKMSVAHSGGQIQEAMLMTRMNLLVEMVLKPKE